MSESGRSSTGDWARAFYQGKSVLVTGGTSGIGQALAGGFAEAGAAVTATGATGAEVEAAPVVAGVSYRTLDVTDADAVAAVAGGFDRLDVLAACAGINLRRDEHEPASFERVLAVNLAGTMRAAAAAREALKAAGGSVLTVASMYAFHGAPHAPGYAASKGGVAQLTRSLAIAWAGDGIRVNALAPGWIETRMTEPLRADAARNAEILARTPMNRWGTPGDLVGPALFLCSPLAGFMTGVIVPVDGGYLAV